jgi:Fic family protein
MESLVLWLHESLRDGALHPLLTVAVFGVHFLAIHPFQDGNGRLSRILTTLLLLKTGYLYVPYSSLESIIELNKSDYYLALRKTQGTLGKEKVNLEPWIVFFLRALKIQKDNLAKKIEREHSRLKLPAVSVQIIEIVTEHGQATISDIQSITNANRNTIKLRLRELVADNHLVQQGKGKGTRYVLGSLSAQGRARILE